MLNRFSSYTQKYWLKIFHNVPRQAWETGSDADFEHCYRTQLLNGRDQLQFVQTKFQAAKYL